MPVTPRSPEVIPEGATFSEFDSEGNGLRGVLNRHENDITDLQADYVNKTDHVAATEAHGATGTVVGTTNTQTLTNKTISGADNTITNLPTSAYADYSITNTKLSTTDGELGSGWVNSSSTITTSGWSGSPTKYFISVKIGRIVFFYVSVSGTSNAAATSISNLPYTAQSGFYQYIIGTSVNNGAAQAISKAAIGPTNYTTMSFYNGVGSSGFTASGSKTVEFQGYYVAAS